MNQPASIAPCLHCERAPQANAWRLCEACVRIKGLRNIYKKRKGWTPAWDAHLQALVERAKKHLPLFPRGETRKLPPRPSPSTRANQNRRKSVLIRHQTLGGDQS